MMLKQLAIGLLAAVVLTSCASPDKLARQSGEELSQGHAQKAYEKALQALDKEPENPAAREALGAAATGVYQDDKAEMLRRVSSDTLGAADVSLELDKVRRQVARYHATMTEDASFAPTEGRIRFSAARICYTHAELSQDNHKPKAAYQAYVQARNYQPDFRDVQERVREAYDAAVARVAVLPFANQTDLSELSRTLESRVDDELGQRVTPDNFHFTRLVPPDDIHTQMSVSDLDNMDRATALKIGQRLGADEVVWGRFYDLRSNTTTDNYYTSIYQHVIETDASGNERARYEEHPITVVSRQRDISVHYDYEILDARTRAVLGKHTEVVRLGAKVVWTDYIADASPTDYTLVTPEARKAAPDTAAKAEKQWKAKVGSYKLADFLDDARLHRDRAHYTDACREYFTSDTRAHPVLLAELPPDGDLARNALDDMWKPLYKTLAELDAK